MENYAKRFILLEKNFLIVLEKPNLQLRYVADQLPHTQHSSHQFISPTLTFLFSPIILKRLFDINLFLRTMISKLFYAHLFFLFLSIFTLCLFFSLAMLLILTFLLLVLFSLGTIPCKNHLRTNSTLFTNHSSTFL